MKTKSSSTLRHQHVNMLVTCSDCQLAYFSVLASQHLTTDAREIQFILRDRNVRIKFLGNAANSF